jgi:acyl carrier protein
MSVRSVIMERVAMVAEQQGKSLAPLNDDLRLLDSGLDSLCIAIIVANLDDELGLDPLSSDEDVAFPVTLGDFIRLYENATAPA